MKNRAQSLILSLLILSSVALLGQKNQNGKTISETVILIGFDGMSPDGISKAKTLTIDALINEGASSMLARGVMPTSSGANWGSMLLGAGPEQHGITTNGWRTDKYEFVATNRDKDGFFPSVFDAVRLGNPQAKIGVFHEWNTIKYLFNNKAVNKIVRTKKVEETLKKALEYIKKDNPKFVFIHLDGADHAGHTYGHGTKEYYDEIAHIDKTLGEFVQGLKEAGLYKNSNIILSADHGGKGKSHGGNSIEELLIPWVITGPGIKKNTVLKNNINTYDTAATIAYILNSKLPSAWIGKPVLEAFKAVK